MKTAQQIYLQELFEINQMLSNADHYKLDKSQFEQLILDYEETFDLYLKETKKGA